MGAKAMLDDGLFDYAAAVPGGVLAVPAHRYLKRISAKTRDSTG